MAPTARSQFFDFNLISEPTRGRGAARGSFPLLQGAHEARVWLDAGALVAQQCEGGIVCHSVVADEIGKHNGGGARDAL